MTNDFSLFFVGRNPHIGDKPHGLIEEQRPVDISHQFLLIDAKHADVIPVDFSGSLAGMIEYAAACG